MGISYPVSTFHLVSQRSKNMLHFPIEIVDLKCMTLTGLCSVNINSNSEIILAGRMPIYYQQNI